MTAKHLARGFPALAMACVALVATAAFPSEPPTAQTRAARSLHAHRRVPFVTDPLGPVTVPAMGDIQDVHDPDIAREGKRYYVYYTHGGIHTLSSVDLVHWQRGPDALPGDPAWVPTVIPNADPNDLWAPDLSFWGGQWHLYYAKSGWIPFPTRNSAIGHATSPTLDPTDPRYGWVDHGPVVTSQGGFLDPSQSSGWNAIDPSVALDRDGTPWLTWGSAFDGIFIQRLASDGSLAPGSQPIELARRGHYLSVVEASQLVRHRGYWWLFVSYDYCCSGTRSSYNIRVGRSRHITGPYVDRKGESLISPRDGRPSAQDAGEVVLRGYGSVYGPGHQSVLRDRGRWWLVHHWYDPAGMFSPTQAGLPELAIRPLDWGRDGWPVARGWKPALPVPTPF